MKGGNGEVRGGHYSVGGPGSLRDPPVSIPNQHDEPSLCSINVM